MARWGIRRGLGRNRTYDREKSDLDDPSVHRRSHDALLRRTAHLGMGLVGIARQEGRNRTRDSAPPMAHQLRCIRSGACRVRCLREHAHE